MEKKEYWIPIKNYEKYYEISSFGRVRRKARKGEGKYNLKKKVLKRSVNNKNMYVVALSNPDKKERTLHTVLGLMRDSFFNLKENERIILKDKNSKNIKLENLIVTTKKEIRMNTGKTIRNRYVQFMVYAFYKGSDEVKIIYTPDELKKILGLKSRIEAIRIFENKEYEDEYWKVISIETYCINSKKSNKRSELKR